eukprot:scaffold323383_cov31-Tisochrysis_lutea.AAC.2
MSCAADSRSHARGLERRGGGRDAEDALDAVALTLEQHLAQLLEEVGHAFARELARAVEGLPEARAGGGLRWLPLAGKPRVALALAGRVRWVQGAVALVELDRQLLAGKRARRAARHAGRAPP